MGNKASCLLFAACLFLLSASRLYSQVYHGNGCGNKTNYALKKYIKNGLIPQIADGTPCNYEAWSTSYLKREGKPPVILPEKDDEIRDSKYRYDKWTCMYTALSLTDNDTSTAWVEGASDEGIGEIVIANVSANKPVLIWAGLGKSEELFKANNRPKKIRVYLLKPGRTSAAQCCMFFFDLKVIGIHEAELKDQNGFQTLPIPEPADNDKIQFIAIEILSVFRGTKFNDTCISEIKNK
ncbi:MAG: hypothetical protein MUD12_05675 [Spirochaetes bacterium]|nr:hypothetical protein [Spirochaetota bacterium]